MKNRMISGLCLLFAVLSLVSCHPDDTTLQNYIAVGAIPTEVKLFPTVDDTIQMTLNDSKQILTDDDIRTLTHYVDVWASINDQRGSGMLEDELKEFTDDEMLEKIKATIQNSTLDYEVTGTQILTMKIDEDERVQIPYIVKLKGCNPDEGIPEGEYEAVHALCFKKVDGKWYEDGVSFVLLAPAGTIQYDLDEITGHYTITPTGEYYTADQSKEG